MSEITVDIQSLTDEELSDALRIRGAQYGPIGPSTRAVYENKLRKLLMGIDTLPASEPTESGGQGESSPGRSRRTRQTKPIPDKDDEEEEISYRPQVDAHRHQPSTSLKSPLARDSPRQHSPERVPYSSIQSDASRHVPPAASSASQMTRRSVYSPSEQRSAANANPRSYATQQQPPKNKGGWLVTVAQLFVFGLIAVALFFVLQHIDVFSSQPAIELK